MYVVPRNSIIHKWSIICSHSPFEDLCSCCRGGRRTVGWDCEAAKVFWAAEDVADGADPADSLGSDGRLLSNLGPGADPPLA